MCHIISTWEYDAYMNANQKYIEVALQLPFSKIAIFMSPCLWELGDAMNVGPTSYHKDTSLLFYTTFYISTFFFKHLLHLRLQFLHIFLLFSFRSNTLCCLTTTTTELGTKGNFFLFCRHCQKREKETYKVHVIDITPRTIFLVEEQLATVVSAWSSNILVDT
jgi:hypothetical protein